MKKKNLKALEALGTVGSAVMLVLKTQISFNTFEVLGNNMNTM